MNNKSIVSIVLLVLTILTYAPGHPSTEDRQVVFGPSISRCSEVKEKFRTAFDDLKREAESIKEQAKSIKQKSSNIPILCRKVFPNYQELRLRLLSSLKPIQELAVTVGKWYKDSNNRSAALEEVNTFLNFVYNVANSGKIAPLFEFHKLLPGTSHHYSEFAGKDLDRELLVLKSILRTYRLRANTYKTSTYKTSTYKTSTGNKANSDKAGSTGKESSSDKTNSSNNENRQTYAETGGSDRS